MTLNIELLPNTIGYTLATAAIGRTPRVGPWGSTPDECVVDSCTGFETLQSSFTRFELRYLY